MFAPLPRCYPILTLLTWLVTAVLAGRTSAAATLVVCPDGCAFADVQQAIDAAQAGDTVRVRAGSYTETLRVAKDLTVEGDGPSETIIDGDGLSTVLTVDAGSTVSISGLTITGGLGEAGASGGHGGGIHNEGVLEIRGCFITRNRTDGAGGGIHNGGTLTVERSTLCENTAAGGGGGIFSEGPLEVSESVLAANDAGDDGGGILAASECDLANSTLSDNTSEGDGGGLSVREEAPAIRLTHCTVTRNVAGDTRTSGIFNASAAPVELASSIIALNDPGRECAGAVLSRGYNIASDLSCGLDPRGEKPDQHATNPLLLELGHNGGPTMTHALRADSSAIDAGGTSETCSLAADQRGAPRPAGARCDVGAYEHPACDAPAVASKFTRGDANDDAVLNLTDAVFLLRFLFSGDRAPPCRDAADTDDDGRLLLTDAVFLLVRLFRGGEAIPAPSACGDDPTDDDLACEAASSCLAGGRFGDLWTSAGELAGKPASGEAWAEVLRAAQDACPGKATITNQDSNANVQLLAAAIAFARLHREDPVTAGAFRSRVVAGLRKLVDEGDPREFHGCPPGCGKAINTTLAWGREAGAYALAADLVGHRTPEFEEWTRNLAEVWVACDGRTLLEAFHSRPNNWGLMAFGSLVAIYAYLGDEARLEEVRHYFARGLRGEIPDCEGVPDGEPCYVWGGTRDPDDKDLSWHCDPSSPSLIAPPCTVPLGNGAELELDGLIPDDQRRSCSLCPPARSDLCAGIPEEDHCLEPRPDDHITDWMNGAVMGARILDRAGMPVWEEADRALLRMIIAHMVGHCELTCEDEGFRCESLYNCKDWVVPLLDEAYDLEAALAPRPETDCDCPLEISGRGAGASKNAGFGAYIAP